MFALAVTVTVNVTDAVPAPFAVFAGTVKFIPASNWSFVTVSYPVAVIVPSTKVVPSGILSPIFTVPSAYPLFVAVIVYVIVSPGSTVPAAPVVLLVLTVLVFTTVISGFT